MRDRTMLRPEQFMLETLEAYDVEEVYYEQGAGRRILFPGGWIMIYIDAQEGLEVAGVNFRPGGQESGEDCAVAVCEASGANIICLPAKRADLVEVSGEPKRESSAGISCLVLRANLSKRHTKTMSNSFVAP